MDIAGEGEAALAVAFVNDYDLIILDVMLAGGDGFEVCRESRTSGSAVPVLMFTARNKAGPRVGGRVTRTALPGRRRTCHPVRGRRAAPPTR